MALTALFGVIPPANSVGVANDYYVDTATDRLYGPKETYWPLYSLRLPIDIPTGATLLINDTAPVTGDGSEGDYYVDLVGSRAYGPKTSGNWGSGTAYDLNTGTIRYGTTVPANTLGFPGDFYINTTNSNIYGPKTSVWPSGVSLIGPQGDDGQDGTDGLQGPTGPQGLQGIPGENILLNSIENRFIYGTFVPDSSFGRDGDIYLNTTTNTFYGPKTNGIWRKTGTTNSVDSGTNTWWTWVMIALVVLLLLALIAGAVWVYMKYFRKMIN